MVIRNPLSEHPASTWPVVGWAAKKAELSKTASSSAHFFSFPYIVLFNNQCDLHRDNIQKF